MKKRNIFLRHFGTGTENYRNVKVFTGVLILCDPVLWHYQRTSQVDLTLCHIPLCNAQRVRSTAHRSLRAEGSSHMLKLAERPE